MNCPDRALKFIILRETNKSKNTNSMFLETTSLTPHEMILEGQDALDFWEYLENPIFSQTLINCVREAKQLNRQT